MKAQIEALMEQINSGKLENDRAILLRAFINHERGLTIYDIRNAFPEMMDTTIKARIADLLDLGMIKEAGKVKRPVENGKLRSYTLYQHEWENSKWPINAEARRRALFKKKLSALRLKYADLMDEYGIEI